MNLTEHTSTESRALSLLGQGVATEMVAAAIGVSVSRISQLISDPEFSRRIAELRFSSLAKHNERDEKYDSLEDTLINKLEHHLPMMYKTSEILNAIKVVNAARRRGVTSPEVLAGQKEVVNLTMPVTVMQQFNQTFQVDSRNQVIKAGSQELVTIQSARMNSILQSRNAIKGEPKNECITIENRAEIAP